MAKKRQKRIPPPDYRELSLLIESLDPVVLLKLCTVFSTGNDTLLNFFKCMANLDEQEWADLRDKLIAHRALIESSLLNGRRIVFHQTLIDILRKKNIQIDARVLWEKHLTCHPKSLFYSLRTASSGTLITNLLKSEMANIERVVDIAASKGEVEYIATFLGNLQPYTRFAAELSSFIARTKSRFKIQETPYEAKLRQEREAQQKAVSRSVTPTQGTTPVNPPTTRIYWKVLPQGSHPFEKILSHFSQLKQKTNNTEYDITRLELIYSLTPNSIFLGIDEFEGYVVFHFVEAKVSVLECPIVGNAIYVLKDDWKRLSKLTKRELLEEHSNSIIRIVHAGDWFTRLKQICH